jgi:precorrin-6A/cobalt-precorrin-6A reductase
VTGGPGATVLILGGTGEAREIARRLTEAEPGVTVISSLAGRVADPARPAGELRTGGFGGVAGLAAWLAERQVTCVVDATHPYAATMSAHAVAACAATGVPLLGVDRPGWTAGPGDDWREVPSLAAAAALLPAAGRRAFLTTGRQGLAAFTPGAGSWFLIRCVDPPAAPLPAACQVLLARGPYGEAAELALMREHRVDVLVSKNSGGGLTAGKLAAARRLGIPVIMVSRPEPAGWPLWCTTARAAAQMTLRHWIRRHRGPLTRTGAGQ